MPIPPTPKRPARTLPISGSAKKAAADRASLPRGSPSPTRLPPAATPRTRTEVGLEGMPAPDWSLPDEHGTQIRLPDLVGKKVVLYFYPKDDTPGCTRQACAFRDQRATFAEQNAVVLGVSRDGAAAHARFKAKYGLTFPLLSDPEGAVHRAYGAWGEKTMYGKKIVGVLRTTVVIDEQGTVRRVFRNVKVDGHADAVLEALRR